MDKKKIMIIDDTQVIIELEAAILEVYLEKNKIPYKIDSFINPIEALKHLEKDRNYDLILLDIIMPEMHGMEFYRVLKKNYVDLVPKLVFVSTVADYYAKKCLEKNDKISYIKKPFCTEDFLEVVTKYLK